MNVNNNFNQINFNNDSLVQEVIKKYEKGRPWFETVRKIGHSILPNHISAPTNSYELVLKDLHNIHRDIKHKISLNILEDLQLIKPLFYDDTEAKKIFSSPEARILTQEKIVSILQNMPPIFGTQYEAAERDLLELKENFPNKFEENKFYYDWLEKWGKLKHPESVIHTTIQIREGLDIQTYKGKTLTFGCGHQASICRSKQDETSDAHKEELTINLTTDIAPDIQADFRNPELYKLLPDNHFQRIWFESMHIGDNFSTNSLKECFRILEPGGQLEIGDDTIARLVKEPFGLNPEEFLKALGFSKVDVKIVEDSRGNYFYATATK